MYEQQTVTPGIIVAVIQVPLEIPDEIYVRVLSGDYVRMGGVIRDGGGQLVKLLEDASPIDEAQKAAKAGIATVLKNRTAVGIGLGVVAVAVAAGRAAYRAKRKAKAAELAVPTSVENYGDSLAAYLEAARHGNLDSEIIDRLIADLDALKTESKARTTTIEFSTEQAETLVGMVASHTRKLAEANDRELEDLAEPATTQGATVIELRPYLEAQRDIFSQAA